MPQPTLILLRLNKTPLLTQTEFQQQFHTALTEAGFDTREQVLDLMRDIRREVANEHEQIYSHIHSISSTPES